MERVRSSEWCCGRGRGVSQVIGLEARRELNTFVYVKVFSVASSKGLGCGSL